MSENIVKFPDRSLIEEEAGAWLIKLDGDEPLSDESQADLQQWLERSPIHRQELVGLATLWGNMNVLTDLAVPLESQDAIRTTGFSATMQKAFSSYGRIGVAAAIVVLGLTISLTMWFQPDPLKASNGFYVTAVGQQQTTALADGSVVLLNTNSQIKVEYSNQFRNIRLLQGEVHFTVEKNANRPFRVYAGNGRVQAVGTAFSVYLKDSDIDVTVTEGSVALASLSHSVVVTTRQDEIQPSGTDQPLISSPEDLDVNLVALGTLSAGQRGTIANRRENLETSTTLDGIQNIELKEMAKQLSWREGLLTFAGDPLERVVQEISRYTTVSIEITDPEVRATKIGGRFPVGETDAMLDALEANFGLQVTRLSRNHVLLSAADK